MGVHHVSWQTTSSGVEDEYIHAAAIAWLVGDDELVEIERMNSYHGSPIHVIRADIKSRSKATKSLSTNVDGNTFSIWCENFIKYNLNSKLGI